MKKENKYCANCLKIYIQTEYTMCHECDWGELEELEGIECEN